MKYFVTRYTPIIDPSTIYGRPVAYRKLIERQVVECMFPENLQPVTIEGKLRQCLLCGFDDGIHPPIVGFIPFENIDPYFENFPHGQVDFEGQTKSTQDAAQYIVYEGDTEYNLCGQSCVAYALNLPIVAVLDGWKAKERKWWDSLFAKRGSSARGTSDGELQRLVKTLGGKAELLGVALKFPEGKDIRYTPASLARLANRGTVIASVNVDPVTHYLNGSGVLHWVAVVEVFQERALGGYVKYWNSLSNAVEICSWREWMASAKQPYGIIVDGVK